MIPSLQQATLDSHNTNSYQPHLYLCFECMGVAGTCSLYPRILTHLCLGIHIESVLSKATVSNQLGIILPPLLPVMHSAVGRPSYDSVALVLSPSTSKRSPQVPHEAEYVNHVLSANKGVSAWLKMETGSRHCLCDA